MSTPEHRQPPDCPFEVPPFSPPPTAAVSYVWWSWHPLYPKWSQSCWEAATVEGAQRFLTDPKTSLSFYHNKLIRHDGITLTEVQDVPCQKMDVWWKIKSALESGDLKLCPNCSAQMFRVQVPAMDGAEGEPSFVWKCRSSSKCDLVVPARKPG